MTSIAGLRYVIPLFELARDKNILDRVDANLAALSEAIKGSPDLESLLLNPRISAGKKKDVILKLTAGDDFEPLVRDFFCLLMDKKRERVFLFMAQEYKRLLREAGNIVCANVQTPVALTDDYKRDLAQRFAKMTGKTVELTEEIKPDLIAGVKIMVGSKMLDGSLKARLKGMKRYLKEKVATMTGSSDEG